MGVHSSKLSFHNLLGGQGRSQKESMKEDPLYTTDVKWKRAFAFRVISVMVFFGFQMTQFV